MLMSRRSAPVSLQNTSYWSIASPRYRDVINATNTSTGLSDKDSSAKVIITVYHTQAR